MVIFGPLDTKASFMVRDMVLLLLLLLRTWSDREASLLEAEDMESRIKGEDVEDFISKAGNDGGAGSTRDW